MKKNSLCRLSITALAIAVLVLMHHCHSACAEVDTAFAVRAVIPGMTESIDIGQLAAFPLGCHLFLVFTAGSGTLGLSLLKNDTSGDTIFMLGGISSSSGMIPFFKVGQSKGMIDQIADVGANGFAWVFFGVAYSPALPKYSYQFRISLAP